MGTNLLLKPFSLWNLLIIHKSYDQSMGSIWVTCTSVNPKTNQQGLVNIIISHLLSICMGIYCSSALAHHFKRSYTAFSLIFYLLLSGLYTLVANSESKVWWNGVMWLVMQKTSRISKLIYLQNHIRLKLGLNVLR